MNQMIVPIIFTLISAFTNALGFYYFKKASNVKKITQIINKNLIIGGLIFMTGVSLYIIALRQGEVSILYSIASTQYIWVAFLGKRLGEKITTKKIIGIFIIIIGIFIIGLGI